MADVQNKRTAWMIYSQLLNKTGIFAPQKGNFSIHQPQDIYVFILFVPSVRPALSEGLLFHNSLVVYFPNLKVSGNFIFLCCSISTIRFKIHTRFSIPIALPCYLWFPFCMVIVMILSYIFYKCLMVLIKLYIYWKLDRQW